MPETAFIPPSREPKEPDASEMVLRVWRAMRDEICRDPDVWLQFVHHFRFIDGKMTIDHYIPPITLARVAILAMQEPTQAMLAAAHDRIWEFSPAYADSRPDPKGEHPESAERVAADVWREMSAAALKE